MVQVGDGAYFVVKQEQLLYSGQPLQALNLPQNVKGNVKLPNIKGKNKTAIGPNSAQNRIFLLYNAAQVNRLWRNLWRIEAVRQY